MFIPTGRAMCTAGPIKDGKNAAGTVGPGSNPVKQVNCPVQGAYNVPDRASQAVLCRVSWVVRWRARQAVRRWVVRSRWRSRLPGRNQALPSLGSLKCKSPRPGPSPVRPDPTSPRCKGPRPGPSPVRPDPASPRCKGRRPGRKNRSNPNHRSANGQVRGRAVRI
jgi:hypothetical protein